MTQTLYAHMNKKMLAFHALSFKNILKREGRILTT
jgi:hypothetical protein